jgi:hypothetical protein
VNILLQLDAVDEDPRILERLVKLIEIVTAKINEVTNIQNPPIEQAPVAPPIQDVSMAGQQITAMQGVIQSVIGGQLTQDAGKALILAAFPSIDPILIDQMMGIIPPPVEGLPIEQNGGIIDV